MHINFTLVHALTLFLSQATAVPHYVFPREAPPGNSAPRASLERLSKVIPDSYIVVLKKDVSRSIFRRYVGNAGKAFSTGSFHGFEATFANQDQVDALALSPGVDYIEHNRYVQSAVDVPQNTTSSFWNLHRISHREEAPPQPGPYRYLYRPGPANCSTDAYIIDTGIYVGHSDFEGRASHGYNTIGGSNNDGTGHGTHVAGILIGRRFGVWKQGHAVSVKALDSEGLGTFSSVIRAIAWSVTECRNRGKIGRCVVNLSLVGLRSQALNDAVEAAYAEGVPVVVAAGNFGHLAVDYSPASAHNAFTIGAIDIHDQKPWWSNYGIVLDHFAPGVDVRSAYIGGPNSTAVISGTSMAAPHVAGLVNYLQCVEGLTIPRMIRERLEVLATKKEVFGGGNTSPQRIVYNGGGDRAQ